MRRTDGRTDRRTDRPATLWSQAAKPDELMLAYTVGDDRLWDSRLLRWDVLGSLGHIEGLRASGLLSTRDHAALRTGLRAALGLIRDGELANASKLRRMTAMPRRVGIRAEFGFVTAPSRRCPRCSTRTRRHCSGRVSSPGMGGIGRCYRRRSTSSSSCPCKHIRPAIRRSI